MQDQYMQRGHIERIHEANSYEEASRASNMNDT